MLLKVVERERLLIFLPSYQGYQGFSFLLKVDRINGDTPLMLVSYFVECGDWLILELSAGSWRVFPGSQGVLEVWVKEGSS